MINKGNITIQHIKKYSILRKLRPKPTGAWYSTIYEILRIAYSEDMPPHLREEIKQACVVLTKQIKFFIKQG